VSHGAALLTPIDRVITRSEVPSKSPDAIGYFSGIAEEFHAGYDLPEFQDRLRVWRGVLERHAPRGGLALDMGCGTGVFSFQLAKLGSRVVGVDGGDEMVAFCERQRIENNVENVRFFQGRLPHIDETGLSGADLVVSSSVVEYVDDLDGTLALFARLLRPGGTLVISMPNATSLSRTYQRLKYRLKQHSDVYGLIKHYSSPRRLSKRLRRHGLTLLETHYYAHGTRLAQMAHKLRLSPRLTEDLFVAVFRKDGR